MAGDPQAPASDVGPAAPIPLTGRKKKAKKRRVLGLATTQRLRELTPQEERFVHEYLVDLQAGPAVKRAGYNHTTATSANVFGCNLLKRPHVARALNRAFEARLKRVDVRADDVLHEVAAIAFSDIRSVVEVTGAGTIRVKDSKDWTPEQAAAVESVEETKNGIKVKFYDKPGALSLLMRHMNMFPSTKVVHDPASGRTGIEIPGGGNDIDVISIYQIPDNGRDARPAPEALAVNGHGAPPG
jgi:phage terminase small subunit